MLCLLFLALFLKCSVCSGADAISGNQSLSGDQTIVSKQATFELGFFRGGKSSNFYVGIWYKNVSLQTVVWVANRETPVKDKNSSSLRLQGSNLVLFNESKVPIWSTNVGSLSSGSVMAVLRDDGNFVLTEGASNVVFWESFNHPTDTWLPGGRLAFNKATNRSQSFVSWKNSEDPAPGRFALEFDGNGNQYVITWNRTRQYWATGRWNEQSRDFEFVPELRYINFYNFSFVNTENETYFTYDLINNNVISRLVMDVSGQIKSNIWSEENKQWRVVWSQPVQQCTVYSYCGEFGVCNTNQESMPFCNCLEGFEHMSDEDWSLNDFSGGCKRKAELQCQNNGTAKGKKDKFKVLPDMNSPDNSRSVTAESVAECESRCLSNCSCTAYAFNNSGCSIWEGKLSNIQLLSPTDNMETTLYIRLAASEFASGKNKTPTVIGAVLGSFAAAFVILGVILFVVRRYRKATVGYGNAVEGSLVAFSYRDLQNITKNFSDKLGAGAFGSVFKGSLPDSSVVAVKKLESISQGEKQFRAEVSTIGTVQHINLVRLRGFCSQGANKLLVYEYMENRSLDCHLFHEDESKILSWKLRYQIALGTARGLAYLHEKCREVIIHCDIKPENILLDADFCPKVADFGLAKLMGRNFSRVLTTIRGTRGYLAPEWISGVAVTAKADVYSYGMMVFELISGKRNSESSTEDVVRFFPSSAAEVMVNNGDVVGLLDPKLDRQGDAAEVSRLCKVACWCIQEDETHRPCMVQVVQILEDVLDVNVPPVPRALRTFMKDQKHEPFFTESSTSQGTSE